MRKIKQTADIKHGRSPFGVRCEVERSTAFNFVRRKASPEETSDRLDFSSSPYGATGSSVGGIENNDPTQVHSGNDRPELESFPNRRFSIFSPFFLNFFSISSQDCRFTLIEMLVVIGIMILVASISIVSVAPMMKGRHLDSAARVVQSALYRARTYAATMRKDTKVEFYDSGSDKGKIEVTVSSKLIDKPYWLPEGVEFESIEDSGGSALPEITFGSMGSLSDPEDDVIILIADKQKDMKKKITVVHTTGLTRIQDQ
jgi:Tfp pilus assembly protein FimT